MINFLKKLMDKENIDGYVIPKNDEFFSEYSFPNRLKLISNFSGSAGLAIILKDKNFLFVDGRYTLQASIESGKNFEIFEIPKITPFNVLKKKEHKLTLGFDPKLFTEMSLKSNFRDSCNLMPINNKIEIIQDDKFIYSYFLIEGKLKINDETVKKGDFFKVIADEKIEYHTLKESKVFVIKSPVSTGYLTYSSRS